MSFAEDFDVHAYVQSLHVSQDDEDYQNAMKKVEIAHLMYPNAHLVKAELYGVASAMENQMKYYGGVLIPSKERRISQLGGSGFLKEDDLREYRFANETLPHVNEEESIADTIQYIERELDDLTYALRVAAISFVTNVREHDKVALDLDLLTYSGIKAKAQYNKRAKAPTVAKEVIAKI